MGLTHVLDTNAGVYIVDNRLAIPLPSGSFGISVVTEIELLSKPAMTAGEMATARACLSKLGLVELSPSIREEAARLRRDERLKLPDAIIVATALVEGAVLEVVSQPAFRNEALSVPGSRKGAKTQRGGTKPSCETIS